jgi:probable rRNA maturation factor
MPYENINFLNQDIDFKLPNETRIKSWIIDSVSDEDLTFETITYIFCSDNYLLELNKEHLNHNTLTDVITFPYNYDPIHTDIFISIERVKENAIKFKVTFEVELYRVMIHGLLHMFGYLDKTAEEKILMRKLEDYFLKKLDVPSLN